MYLMIQTLSQDVTAAGDTVILKFDRTFSRTGAFGIDGKAIGYLADAQPDGCLKATAVNAKIGDYRVLCTVAVAMRDTLFLHTQSPILVPKTEYVRTEHEGYAILNAK